MDFEDANGLSDADYANIGRIVVEATAIEDLVHIAMRVLMKDQWLEDLVGADVQWSWRQDRTCLLIDAFITDPDQRERARSWMKRANDLQGQRNRVVHTHWMAGSEDGEPVVSGSKRTTRGRKRNLPGRPLRDAAARIDDVEQLVQELANLRETWFRHLYEPSMIARGISDWERSHTAARARESETLVATNNQRTGRPKRRRRCFAQSPGIAMTAKYAASIGGRSATSRSQLRRQRR